MHGLFKWSAKWWPGLIPLVVLWGIAAWTNTAPLETDLAARSAEALKGAVLDKTAIEVDGRDVTLSADAFSEDGRRTAITSVEAVPGVRLVNDETRLVPDCGHSPHLQQPSYVLAEITRFVAPLAMVG